MGFQKYQQGFLSYFTYLCFIFTKRFLNSDLQIQMELCWCSQDKDSINFVLKIDVNVPQNNFTLKWNELATK